jgi:plasmid stabilization system protein ParE
MLAAAAYYEYQAPGLGQDFLGKIDAAIADISSNPERWPILGGQTRRRLVHRFPYGVYYRIEPEEIVIVAIADLRRRPDYWVTRRLTN